MHTVTELVPGRKYMMNTHTVTHEGLKEVREVYDEEVTYEMGIPTAFTLLFVKGSSDGPSVDKQDGFTTEQLLAVSRMYLEAVNAGDLENDYTRRAIKYIAWAEKMLKERAKDRSKRGVLGTYKK